MSIGPKIAMSRIADVTHVWETLRPTKSFSGLTLEQFREAINASHEARAEITELESRLMKAIKNRTTADAASLKVVKRIINAVRSDQEEGEDGEMYGALGYITESARGRRRRRANGEMKAPTEPS